MQDVEVDLRSGIARIRGEHSAHQVPDLVAALRADGYEAGAATGVPAVNLRQAGGCGAGASAAVKGRGGCCCS